MIKQKNLKINITLFISSCRTIDYHDNSHYYNVHLTTLPLSLQHFNQMDMTLSRRSFMVDGIVYFLLAGCYSSAVALEARRSASTYWILHGSSTVIPSWPFLAHFYLLNCHAVSSTLSSMVLVKKLPSHLSPAWSGCSYLFFSLFGYLQWTRQWLSLLHWACTLISWTEMKSSHGHMVPWLIMYFSNLVDTQSPVLSTPPQFS